MMNTKMLIVIIIVTCSLLNSGCATIKYGGTQIITINSTPEKANISIQPSKVEAVTPAKIVLSRRSSYVVNINKNGFKPESISIESSASSSLWRNAIWIHPIGWIIGVIVDLSTGAGKDLTPESINVKLTPLPTLLLNSEN